MENKKFIDVLFENRNKKYGAYELRSTENNSLMKALLTGVGIVILGMGGFVYSNKNSEQIIYDGNNTYDSITLVNIKPLDKEFEKPIVPPINENTQKKRAQADTKQVKEVMPNPSESPKKQETIIDRNETKTADLGADNREGTIDSNGQIGGGDVNEGDKNIAGSQNTNIIAKGDENNITKPIEKKKILTSKDAKVMAIYPGCEKESKKGNDALTKCLNDKLSSELIYNLEDFANENSTSANAKMQFIISKNGEITQIKSVNGSDATLGKEAKIALDKINKNLLRKGKKITPAQYEDGTNADLIFTIPVRFQKL